jgi:sulfite reductase beta subunit
MGVIEGPPRPYTNYLPDYIAKNVGKWHTHNILEPGIIEHVSKSGDKIYTIRIGSTTNSRYSTETIRKFSAIADKYSKGVLRFTNAFNIEFLTDNKENAYKIREEMSKIGFPTGGWGNRLWNVTSCAGYFHCALAATDAPSVAKSIADDIYKYFNQEELPAKLTIGSSGCPSSCGGSFLADISIIGIHTEIPIITEGVKACDLLGVTMICPVGAIALKTNPTGEKTIEIRESLCIGCGLCVGACGGIIFKTPERTDGHAIVVGGKSSSTNGGTNFGRIVVPYLPNEPPRYEMTVKIVRRIIDTWKNDAKKGERIITWVHRIGWDKFFEKTKIPYFEQSMEDLDLRALTTLRDGANRQ